MIIPAELKERFSPYQGKGLFTVGEVEEYILHWHTMKECKCKGIMEWIQYVIAKSEHNKYCTIENKNDYVNDNIDCWIAIWRNCQNDMIHFSRSVASKFAKENLVAIVENKYAVENEIEYSLVKFI